MKIGRLLAAVVWTTAMALNASAQPELVQGKIDGYVTIVEATEEADGPSLVAYRTWSGEMEKSRAEYERAVRELSERKFQKLVEGIEDAEFRATLEGVPTEEGKGLFCTQLDQDFLDMEILVADSLQQADRQSTLDTVVEMQKDVQNPETLQAFETGKVPWTSTKAAAGAGGTIGTVVGKPIGKVVGPALGAVLTTGVIGVSAVLRLPVYLGVKFLSSLGKGFYFAWAKARPARDVIARLAKAGWTWTATRVGEARESVRKGWEEVSEWLKKRFGGGDDNGGDNGSEG